MGSDNDVSKDEVDGGDEDDRIHDTPKSRPRRLRAESLMSVSSDVFTPPGSPGPGSASLSPTYKMSKKRAQQLRSTPSTPPEDLKDGTETMSEGEVVHCACQHTEGDGMMVQCESCLTWQHGSCLGIENADQVPEKYVCCICIAPPLARQSLLYNLDMDWIREGKMTTLDTDPDQAAEAELKILSDTMADLVNLSSVLHSLQIKLSVARHKTNPKVFMWSNVWDETALGVSDNQEAVSEDIETVSAAGNDDEDETDEVTNNLHLVKKELENHLIENNLENQSNSKSDMKHDENSIEANIGINGISEVKIESKNEDEKIKSDSMDVDNPPAGKENGIEHDKNETIINENEKKIESNTDNADEKS